MTKHRHGITVSFRPAYVSLRIINHTSGNDGGIFGPLGRAAIRSTPMRQEGAEPMRTIAFVTQKGGSGKSTLASSLAVAAAELGERVCVVDMDPQASLVTWAKNRGVDDVPVVAASANKLTVLLEAAEKNRSE